LSRSYLKLRGRASFLRQLNRPEQVLLQTTVAYQDARLQ
jgi:hypothetical protein